jgi:hypothetical protein
MSDISQGPGWWQASDGKWYPPEQAPGAAAPGPAGPPPGYGGPPAGGPPGGYQVAGAGAGGEATVGAAFGYGWKKFQEFLGIIIIAAVVYLLGVLVFGFIGNIIASTIDDGLFGSLISGFINLLVSSIVSIVLIRATLAIVDGKPLDSASIFSGDQLGEYIIGSLIFSAIALVGYILCIIPGIIFTFLAWFWGYFLLDKKLSPVDSIKASIEMVRQHVGTLLGWAVAAFFALLVGFLLCCVGTLVAAPVVYIGTAYLYRRLNNEPVAA